MPELTHIGETITIGNLPPQQKKNLNALPKNYGLSNKPPYVKPTFFPNEIIKENFTFEERENFIMVISTKQKTNSEWDAVRAKLPESFLNKIKIVIKECWKNGFCNPMVRDNELVWSQIKGHERNMRFQEQCDLCTNNSQSGNCKGKFIYNDNGHRNFKKCWEGA